MLTWQRLGAAGRDQLVSERSHPRCFNVSLGAFGLLDARTYCGSSGACDCHPFLKLHPGSKQLAKLVEL